MADARDYTIGVPTKPPEGLISWLLQKGELSKNFLIYKSAWVFDPVEQRRRDLAECVCTACGERFYLEKVPNAACRGYASAPFGILNRDPSESVISGDSTCCPECGSAVKAVHVGCVRYGFDAEWTRALTVHVVGNIPYFLCWAVEKWVSKDGSVDIIPHMYEGYAFDGRKAVKLTGYYKYFTAMSWLPKWEQKGRCTDTIGTVSNVYPFDAHLLDGTCLENAKLDIYAARVQNPSLVTYSRIYQKHKNVENLVMQGAANLLQEKMDKAQTRYYGYTQYKVSEYGIDWKAKRPCEMLGMNKSEFAACVQNRWTLEEYDVYMLLKRVGVQILQAEMKTYVGYGKYNLERLVKFDRPRGVSVNRCIRYLEKQTRTARNVTALLDYWNMKRQLGEELQTDAEIFPQSLQNAHDTCILRQRERKNALLSEKVAKRAAALERYCFAFEGLEIRIPQTATDLYNEGKMLGHCVYSYLERHAIGKTAILFVRHADAPDKPYFTLELDEENLAVRQNRGKHNCDRTEEVVRFEEKFLQFLQSEMRRKA